MLVSGSASAGGGGLAGGATEITQLANNVELGAIFGEEAQQVAQQAQQLAHEIQMIQNQLNMYQNLLDNTSNLGSFIWGNVFSDLQALASAVQQGNAIAYSASNMNALWQQRYQGYSNYLAKTYGPGNFQSDYRHWYSTQRDGLHGALRSANLQSQQFATEEATLNTLENMSQTASGRMQAIQVGNQIAMQQVRQSQKLRELVMAQIQAQTNYLASEAEKDAANQARNEKFFSGASGVTVGNEAQYNPGNLSGTNP
ncbi:hypothetical protein AAY24_18255 (plasmid) [Sedimenticola thiotaurini]|uniref:P-type conjugative transfer protein TrbJ n=2 Tax=Sedimenticola thiotaurini TaxID=1543721 RepID=A0A0F7K3M2_9GAMM|nr:hypothetical protein AAY24_18255 [Sedimenticola thiotaurini]